MNQTKILLLTSLEPNHSAIPAHIIIYNICNIRLGWDLNEFDRVGKLGSSSQGTAGMGVNHKITVYTYSM